jgi:hypothetical protein
MIKIAHRGNFEGRNTERENDPGYVYTALNSGYNVVVDVWLIDKIWYLGHSFPKVAIDISWIQDNRIWVHAKNLEGYVSLYNNPKVHVFWHDKDEYVFTSKGIKWANVGVETNDGIMFLPEHDEIVAAKIRDNDISPLGVCSNNFSYLLA